MKQERSNPQEIVGRQALFVVNLEPKRMAGKRPGTPFDIGFADGITPVLAVPEREVPNGVGGLAVRTFRSGSAVARGRQSEIGGSDHQNGGRPRIVICRRLQLSGFSLRAQGAPVADAVNQQYRLFRHSNPFNATR